VGNGHGHSVDMAACLALHDERIPRAVGGSEDVRRHDVIETNGLLLPHGDDDVPTKHLLAVGRTGQPRLGPPGVAVQLNLDAGGRIQQAGIGLTNVGVTAIRARRSEDLLRGKAPDERLSTQAAQFAAEDCAPSADLRGSEEYKRNMVRVLTMRALNTALQRAKA